MSARKLSDACVGDGMVAVSSKIPMVVAIGLVGTMITAAVAFSKVGASVDSNTVRIDRIEIVQREHEKNAAQMRELMARMDERMKSIDENLGALTRNWLGDAK